MNRSSVKLTLLILAAFAVVLPAFGQDWPTLSKTPNSPVACPASSAACTGKEGLLTAPYSGDPIKSYVGRYLDSQATREFQSPVRTIRARTLGIAPERNRLYMIAGSALFAYDLSTFFSRLGSETMTNVQIMGGNFANRQGHPEQFLLPTSWFYAEKAGWTIFQTDGQDRLFGFDYDDRGYVYVAYNPYGWGLLKDDPAGGLSSVWQQLPDGTTGDLTPNRVISVKSNGSYYLIVSPDSGSVSNVYFVGTATTTAHERRTNIRDVIIQFAKTPTGFIGTVGNDGRLRIYTNDGIIAGQSLINMIAPSGGSYSSIDTDGTNFYALSQANSQGTANAKLTIFTPDGNGGYRVQPDIDLGRPYSGGMNVRYGAGFLLVFGQEFFAPAADSVGSANLRLYKVAGTSITPVQVFSGDAMPVTSGVLRQFFANYYTRNNTPGYTTPLSSGVDGSSMGDARIYKTGGHYYLIVAAVGLGDVYDLSGADTIVPKVKKIGRTANGSAAGVAQNGPFYGDEITFTSTSSASTPPLVTWTFTGDAQQYLRSGLAPDIAYQFGGLTNQSFAGGPVTRSATAMVDANTLDSVSVKVQAPQIRVGIKGRPELLFTQPDISSSAAIVSGDQWVDQSDGALEGHFNDWTLDGTTTTKVPDQAVGVGACGARSLIYTAHYGPNNATNVSPSFTMTSTEAKYEINSFNYTVAPYTIGIAEPIKDPQNASNILFAPLIRYSTNSDLPGAGGTAATFTWTLLDANGTPTSTQATGTGTLANPVNFSVPKATFGSSSMQVRLKVDVAPAATACASFATQSKIKPNLSGPTGSITVNGCTSLGAPCSFTFGTPNPLWKYTWSATGPGAVVGNSGDGASFATYTPQFPIAGGYTISVTVENAIGIFNAAPVNIALAQPICASGPTKDNTVLVYFGNTSSCFSTSDQCKPGETISYKAQQIGWIKASCDKYNWDFGDPSSPSNTSTEIEPTHVYAAPGSYVVSMKLKGGLTDEFTITKTLTVGTGGGNNGGGGGGGGNNGGGGGGGNGCPTLTSTSVYLVFSGTASGCTSTFGTCNVGETMDFGALAQNGYNLSCATHTYSWNFGDPSSPTNVATEANPAHIFSGAGTYNVTLSLSNVAQFQQFTIPVKIGGGTQTCPALAAANVAASFASANVPTCHPGGTCTANEPIVFHVDVSNYTCAITTYSWKFGNGDGGTSTGVAPTFTFPAPGDYTVTVSLSNPTTPTPVNLSFPVHVGAQVGSCPEMTKSNVYYNWYGPDSQCTPLYGDCKDSETVGFQVYGAGYSFGCSTHTFKWDWDDGSPIDTFQGNVAATHKFRSAGIFDVTVTITNLAGGSITLTQRVNVANEAGVKPIPGARKHPVHH